MVFFLFFSLRKRGNKVGGRAALELHEIAIGGVAAAETDVEIKVFVVLLGIEAQLRDHVGDALLVHVIVERHARVLLDAAGHVDAVGAHGRAHGLHRRVGIAPRLPLVHHLTYHGPIVA